MPTTVCASEVLLIHVYILFQRFMYLSLYLNLSLFFSANLSTTSCRLSVIHRRLSGCAPRSDGHCRAVHSSARSVDHTAAHVSLHKVIRRVRNIEERMERGCAVVSHSVDCDVR